MARLGGLHRNTYLNSPHLLDDTLRLKSRPSIRFSGHITGCEGYVESAAIGLLTGRFVAEESAGQTPSLPPETTAFGALLNHITKGHIAYEEEMGRKSFQPMNVNFGLFPPVDIVKPEGHQGRWRGKEKGAAKKLAITGRALADLERWLNESLTAPMPEIA